MEIRTATAADTAALLRRTRDPECLRLWTPKAA